jgi:hypothetical protein
MKLTVTHWLLIVGLVAVIGLDIWLDATDRETFSQFFLNFTMGHRWGYLIPFAFGVLTGHFFWPQRR